MNIPNSNFCISIAEETYANTVQALDLHDFAEIRLDLNGMDNDDIGRLFSMPNKRLIATCRRGKYSISERMARLITAIHNGASYVDIEMEEAEGYQNILINTARVNGCKVIISYHNFTDTPTVDKLQKIIDTCRKQGADIVKLVTTAHSPADCARVLSIYSSNSNLVAFAMGSAGRITRLASLYLGVPFTYVSASNGKAVADGQLTFDDMKNLINLLE